jgi:hypothetical protein
MEILIYFIIVVFLGILSAYTSRFHDATHHFGRILAGEKSLESELNDVNKKGATNKERVRQEYFLRGKSITQRGHQDAITPKIQNIRNTIHLISIPLILISGFILFKWYIPLIGVLCYFFIWSNFQDLLPKPNSLFFRNSILNNLRKRMRRYDSLKDDLKVEACQFFIDKLEKLESDISG